jgi:GntR family transcriptional regulator of arabinose operon
MSELNAFPGRRAAQPMNQKISSPKSRDKLLHLQIQSRLKKGIDSGEYQPGTQLPTEKQIMHEFGVSRGTVIRAIRELQSQGILWRKRGAGTYVADIDDTVAQDQPSLHVARLSPISFEHFGGGFQDRLNQTLASLCSQHHAMMSLHCAPPGTEPFQTRLMHACEQIISRKPRSAIYTPMELPADEMSFNTHLTDALQSAGIRVILIDRDICIYPQRSRYTWIGFDNRRSSSLLTRHLLDQGYKRIAFLGTSNSSTAAWDRLCGYLDSLRMRGIPIDDSLIHLIPSLPDDRVCDQLLAGDPPDAIICKDGQFGVFIAQMLIRRGIALGTQMGLAGFDEDHRVQFLPVRLTHISQAVIPLATAAVSVALRDDEHAFEGEHIQIKSDLIIHPSTCGIGRTC